MVINAAGYLINRGKIYAAQGRYGLAIQDFSKAIKLDPTLVMAYHCRGCVYLANGQYELGLKDWSEAYKLNPELAKALVADVEKGQSPWP